MACGSYDFNRRNDPDAGDHIRDAAGAAAGRFGVSISIRNSRRAIAVDGDTAHGADRTFFADVSGVLREVVQGGAELHGVPDSVSNAAGYRFKFLSDQQPAMAGSHSSARTIRPRVRHHGRKAPSAGVSDLGGHHRGGFGGRISSAHYAAVW